MISVPELIYRLKPVSVQQVGQIDDIGIFEGTIKLERLKSTTNTVKFEYCYLLPPKVSGEFITVSQASSITGIQKRTLQRMCQKQELDSIKANNQWYINLDSLRMFTEKMSL